MRLTRIARWCYLHRRITVLSWFVGLVLIGGLGTGFAAETVDNFELPGTDSQRAYDTLAEKFPDQGGDSVRLVFEAEGGFGPDETATVEAVVDRARSIDHVVQVLSPFEPGGEFQVSADGTVAYADLNLDDRSAEVPLSVGEEVVELADTGDTDAVTIEAGGELVLLVEQPAPGTEELIGLAAAVIILLIAFGSLLAMALPVGTALIGIGIGLGLIGLIGYAIDVPSFAGQVAAMIGIGVGIDYALFVVTRYRTALDHDKEPADAVIEAIGTAGRAVMFAGSVVVVALLSMLVMNFVVVRGVGVSSAAVVLVTMVASVTLLPALLGFVGSNINRFTLPFLRHNASHEAARRSIWFRWSRVVQRRPWPVAIGGLLVVIVLSLPLFAMRLGVADAGNGGEEKTSRRAYDTLADGFGPGFNGPFLVVVDAAGSDGADAFELAAAELAATEGIESVAPPRVGPDGSTAVVVAVPDSAPQDVETDQTLARIRDGVAPAVADATGAEVSVGGVIASYSDFGDKIAERLPWFIGVVLVLSFVLLMAVFRSVLVAVKAAILNLLSISAAYGVIVAVFQWGWGADLIGVSQPGPIESWVPMMMFAILFGLSMDYEVFLLSRMREEYHRTGDNALAVADGLATTARVITAAAAIMIAVFMSFVLGDERVLKLIGLGLASAIFIDATIVRLVLVPSTMELLGDRNWWLPGWLDRLLPQLHIEGDHDIDTDAPPTDPDRAPEHEDALA